MPGDDHQSERSAEDRARAAAERAARRAARAGRPAPDELEIPPEGFGAAPLTPAAEAPAAQSTTAPADPATPPPDPATPAPAAGASAPPAPPPDGGPTPAPRGAGAPATPTPPAATPTSTPAGAPEPRLPSAAGAAGRSAAAARPASGAQPPDPAATRAGADEPTVRHDTIPAAERASAPPRSVPRQDVPLASARPVAAAAVTERGGRRGRRQPAGPTEPRRRSGAGGRWGRRLIALLALAAIGGALYLINAAFQPFHDAGSGAVRVTIPEGADVARIGETLERRGVVASGRFFNVNVTLTGRRGKLRPGTYTLRKDMSYGDASEALMQGPKVRVVETFDVTIPEGRSVREVAQLVRRSAVRGRYARAARQGRFLRRARELGLPADRKTLEGFLFPATYQLAAPADAGDLIAKQLDAFEQNFAEVPMNRAKRRNLTRYDVLIIASMVEREAQLANERPLVAAVIHNRLRAGMALGIDATIRYATNNWERPIRVSELEADGPYNTRLRQGLPPTPIGNPGLDSMKAAAAPADVPYLYYVVKPGTCGEHAFSSTDAEFQRDSARYNAERAAAGGKSPTTC